MALPQWALIGIPSTPQPLRAWHCPEGERLEYWSAKDPVINVKTKAPLVGFHSTWSYVRESMRFCHRDLLPSLTGLASALPQHLDNWTYVGQRTHNHVLCDCWVRQVPENNAVNNFTFFADSISGAPVFYSYKGDTSSTAGYLHSPNYDAFDVSYTLWQPGSFDVKTILSAPCVVANVSSSSSSFLRKGGFDVDEFKRHLRIDGKKHLFLPSKTIAELPSEIDWEAKGFVVGVKDQGSMLYFLLRFLFGNNCCLFCRRLWKLLHVWVDCGG
jgi:hypothetical protein